MSNIAVRKNRLATTTLANITPLLGDVFIDITKPSVVIGDGETPGGIPFAHEIHTHPDATTLTAGFMAFADKIKLNALSEAGGIQTLLSNTDPVTSETTINFSSDFTLTDNPGDSRTEFGLSASFTANMQSDIVALVIALS